MSEEFQIVENGLGQVFVTDAGGHSLYNAADEKDAQNYIKKTLNPKVADRKSAAKQAERQNPRR